MRLTAQLQTFLTGRSLDRGIYISMAQIYLQARRFEPAQKTIQKALDLSHTAEDQEYVLFCRAPFSSGRKSTTKQSKRSRKC